MTFRQWLKERYEGSESPKGELYRAMQREDRERRKNPAQNPKNALWKSNYEWLQRHLIELGVSRDQRRALLEAWREYKHAVKNGFA